MTEMCHCGKPLHYVYPQSRRLVEELIETLGEKVKVSVDGRSWMVPRHYIALHGLKGAEIADLGFEELA